MSPGGRLLPLKRLHLIDQPRVCLTVPLGAIWDSSLIFALPPPLHPPPNTSHLLALSISSPSYPRLPPLLAPSATSLGFTARLASLLFHSLPINLVCLGWRGGGEVGAGAQAEREERCSLGDKAEEGNEQGTIQSVKRRLHTGRC